LFLDKTKREDEKRLERMPCVLPVVWKRKNEPITAILLEDCFFICYAAEILGADFSP